MKKNNPKASALIITILILGMVLVIALNVSMVSTKERNMSMGTEKTSLAYQIADSGIEKVSQLIKDNSSGDLSSIDSDCDGFISDSSVGYTVELKDVDGNRITTCSTSLGMVRRIKSIGTKGQFQRAIEVPITSNTISVINESAADISIAIKNNGNPDISFGNNSSGIFKIARCGDFACSSSSIIESEATTSAGWDTSILGTGSSNETATSFIDNYVSGSSGQLRVAYCNDAGSCSLTGIIDSVAWVSSIARGTDGNPIIAYYYNNGSLKIAKCGNISCSSISSSRILDSGTAGFGSTITMASDGKPIITYFRDNGTTYNLRVIKCNSNDCSGALDGPYTVDSVARTFVGGFTGNISTDTGMAIGSDGNPVISYYDASGGGAFKIAKCQDSRCSSGAGYVITSVDSPLGVQPWQHTTIVIGADSLPIASYYDQTSREMRVAKCLSADCASVASYTLDSDGDVGRFSSIAIGKDGLPVVVYSDETNGQIKVLKCGRISCRP